MRLVAVDIGGTHARFSLAEADGGRAWLIGDPVTLKTAEHASFQTAWQEFGRIMDQPLPPAAALAKTCRSSEKASLPALPAAFSCSSRLTRSTVE